MHLLDLILVSVLLPCITGQRCGDIKLENSKLLFYGRNITITFKPDRDKNEEPVLYIDQTPFHSERIYDSSTQTFTFTIFNPMSYLDTRWISVKHGSCYSKYVQLHFKGTLQPITLLRQKEDIDKCDKCVLSTIEHPSETPLGIRCSVLSYNGVSVNVTFTINNVTTTSNTSGQGIYTANYAVQDDDHSALVVCTATYFVNTQRLTLQDRATLYVAKPPKDLQLLHTRLYPGSTSRPGCVSSGGRPAPKLYLYLDPKATSGTQSTSTFDDTSKTYNSTIFLSDVPDITWSQRTILCLQVHQLFGQKEIHGIFTYTYETTDIRTELVETDIPSTTVLNERSEQTVSTIRLSTIQGNVHTTVVKSIGTSEAPTTKSKPSSTYRSSTGKGHTTVVKAIGTSAAPTTNRKPSSTYLSSTGNGHTTVVKAVGTNTTPTTKSQTITNDANIHITDQNVLNPSAENDRLQIIIIAVVCAVLVLIAVIVAVLCVKRRRRPVANVPVQDKTRVEQVAQEEGYASMGGAECQYAVVNKPKKPSAPQANQAPPVKNEPIEMQSQPKKPVGAGELIYADLDKEALTAKPPNAKPTGTLDRPSTPTEYVGIDFARTVALENANKQDE